MRVDIGLKPDAYTPEAFAYRDYLADHGHSAVLCEESSLDPDSDIRIYFMGLRPFWRQGRHERGCVIHEYQSLSMPPHVRLKDAVKRVCNAVPAGRIFLSPPVRAGLSFSGSVPYLYRDMGVSAHLYAAPPAAPDYDLLYCGTLDHRAGLLAELLRLAGLGMRILVVGTVPDRAWAELRGQPNIHLAGRLSRDDLPAVFSRARAGLNYTPDVYPFSIQTSTKTLEYCAAGLGIVSNRYEWVQGFARARGLRPLWLDELRSKDDFMQYDFTPVGVLDLEWSRVLDAAGFLPFLERCAAGAARS